MKEIIQTSDKENNFSAPRLAITIFLLIVLITTFYESKKVIFWETPRETENKLNIFRSLVLSYASLAEKIKSNLGLNIFFEKENNFWTEIKKSPLIFQEVSVAPSSEKENVINKNNENKLQNEILEPPFRILIIGDSFIAVWGGTGDILERELIKYKGVTVKRDGEVSSGLSRPDYFDWPAKARELILNEKPQVAIIMLGSNDAQSMTKNSDGKKIVLNYGKEEWDNEYNQRVSNFLKIFKENNITVFWIGLPVMKNNIYSEKIRHLNSIYEKEVKSFSNSYFVPIWDLFTDANGNYTDYLADEKGKYFLARLQDGIHFSYFGGELAVKEVIKKMGERIKLEIK
jgi:hypothetical protein